MAHLFLIAGHGAGDSGAVGYGYTEEERVRALARRIVAYGGSDSQRWSRDHQRSDIIRISMIQHLLTSSGHSSRAEPIKL